MLRDGMSFSFVHTERLITLSRRGIFCCDIRLQSRHSPYLCSEYGLNLLKRILRSFQIATVRLNSRYPPALSDTARDSPAGS